MHFWTILTHSFTAVSGEGVVVIEIFSAHVTFTVASYTFSIVPLLYVSSRIMPSRNVKAR